ncbi:DUF6151 family protein [Caenimonas terrae]|uniref:DUF6151 family protein n=1 Tax=Caenimonas terrae TaxID=696074 RepID=A0ABW0NGK3_9BURK
MTRHPLQCRCGTVRGHVVRPGAGTRVVCYCKDCQAYAHFLQQPDTILDPLGGTAIAATLPALVHFSQGTGALACMSLSGTGPLRWYAGCCNTPIGNTSRNAKLPYVGLVERCLAAGPPTLQQSFGPVRALLNTHSARSSVKATPLATVAALVRILTPVAWARLRGRYRDNPFFDAATGRPVAPVRELTRAERAAVTDAALAASSDGRARAGKEL